MNRRGSVVIKSVAFLSTIAVLCVACFAIPKKEYSAAERRRLQQFPTFTWNAVMSGKFMTDLETYTVDQFPLRDTWRTFKAFVSQRIFGQQDQNDLYAHNGSVAKMEYPLNPASVSHACDKFEDIYNTHLHDSGSAVFTAVIPDKNAFFATESGHLTMNYPAFYRQVQAETPFATFVPIDHLLTGESYFKTDTHWKQDAILPVADALLTAMGTTPATDHTMQTVSESFYGVYSGQYALPIAADTLTTVHSDAIDSMTVWDGEHQKPIKVYTKDALASDDPYEIFVGGSLSLVTITNPSASTDRELIIFRDSFGSAIAPLLAEGYRTVTLIDIRYLPRTQLAKYVDFHGQDILFLYSTSVLNHSETLK